MNLKKSLESRIKGWFPQQPKLPKAPVKIDFQKQEPKPRMERSYVLGLIGAIAAVLIVAWQIFFVLFLGAFKFLNNYTIVELLPQLTGIQYFVFAGVGLAAAVLAYVGVSRKNTQGGVLLVIAGVMTVVACNLLGVVPLLLMVGSGAMELAKYPPAPRPSPPPGGRVFAGIPADFWTCIGYFLCWPIISSVFVFLAAWAGSENPALAGIFLPQMGVYFSLGVRELRKRHALNDNYRILLLALSGSVVAAAGALLWLRIINPVGYFATSIIGVSVFTTFYAFTGRLSQKANVDVHRKLSLCLALLGIALLALSLAQVSHVEAKQTRGLHGGPVVIVNTHFVLNNSIPGVEVAENLTTNDYVYFEINVVRVDAVQNEASSVSVQVTNQSASASSTPKIYLSLSVTNWVSKAWDPTENGTYYFRLHYDYVVPDQMDVTIGYDVYSYELVPTKVYDPVLSQFMAPVLVSALALLAMSLSFSVRRVSEIRALKFQSQT